MSGAQSLLYDLFKVPTRNIFVYTGTQPLYISAYALSNSNPSPSPLNNLDQFTIIASNADIVVFGSMDKNMMLITNQDMIFA
jgi:hypothetical protein